MKWIERAIRTGVGLVFVLAGSGKFALEGNLAAQFAGWGYPSALLVAVGVAEVAGGTLLVVNRGVRPSLVVLSLVMAGAVATHVRFFESMGWPLLPTAMLLGMAAVIALRRQAAGSNLRPKHPSAVELVPFVAQRDLPLLRVWLDRGHVTPWWGDPEKALAHASEQPSAMHALIAVDDEPVGYVCWQRLGAEELSIAGLCGLPPDHVDVDILIGEEGYVGRGLGPQALLMVIERLKSEGVSSAGLATDMGNQRARRAFEKAGFHFLQEFEEGGRRYHYLTRNSNTVRRPPKSGSTFSHGTSK